MPEESSYQKNENRFGTFLIVFFLIIGVLLLVKFTSKDEKTYAGPCARQEAYGDQTGNYKPLQECIEAERAKPDPPDQQYPIP